MSDVLVMNASYEPLGKVSWEDAITMVTKGKAYVEEAHPTKVIRHPGGEYPWPVTVRLRKYVKIPFSFGEQPWSKVGVLKAHKYLCAFCGKRGDTVEHIQPTSRGGEPRGWLNTVAACQPCNNRKGNRTLEEAHMTLLYEPFVPMQYKRIRGTKRR